MFYGFSLAIGIILLGLSIFMLKGSLTFLKNSERAIGNVVELKEIDSDDAGITYLPIFKFRTSRGQEVVYKHHSSSSPAAWDIGEAATFIYDPENPDSASILGYFNVFGWAVVLAAIAMPFIVIGAGYFLAQGYLK